MPEPKDPVRDAFAGDLSKEDWVQFLEDGASFLDRFNSGLANATKRMGDQTDPKES